MYPILILMNDWIDDVEDWFNQSSMVFAEDEFDRMEKELVRGFDNLTDEYDRIFSKDSKEFGFSESYFGVGSKIVREEVDVILYDSYPVNIRPDTKIRVRKIRRNVRPVSVQGRVGNTICSSLSEPLSGIEKPDRDSSEDVIVTDKNIKVVSQLPINNKKENIEVVADIDNSVTISHLNSEGRRCTRTSIIPYDIDFETAKATYKNGILEITFGRK
jgi:HSP20 family molecular chaperone IbpA